MGATKSSPLKRANQILNNYILPDNFSSRVYLAFSFCQSPVCYQKMTLFVLVLPTNENVGGDFLVSSGCCLRRVGFNVYTFNCSMTDVEVSNPRKYMTLG